jgi:UDP-N-acetylmuramoylalanine--D-glutamate ligase
MLDAGYWTNKRVTILGLARSGEAAANLLSDLGARVLVSDQKDEKQLRDEVARLARAHPQIRFHLGGHPDEIIKSADLVFISPGVPTNIPVLKSAREKGLPVIGEAELAYRVCRAPIIAITGTKGKSTTSTLLGQILTKSRSSNTIVAGNIGTAVPRCVLDLTELDLLVLETSSFQLETTVHFAPEVGVILNITRDHFDRYNSIEDYAAAKYRIFANQTRDNYTVLNADDPLTMACASRTRARVILFSSRRRLDEGLCVEDGEIVAKSDRSRIAILKRDELRIPGRHNLENVLAAAAVSLVYGADLEVIRGELKSFPGLEHALEFVNEVRGVKFIDDSKSTNVASLKAALESFPSIEPVWNGKNGNVILIMGGRDKGNDYAPLKPLVQKKVNHLVLIGESAEKIQNSIGGYTSSHRAATMEDAVWLAYSLAKSGDTVLLSPACASFDMFTNYAERGVIFKGAVRKIAEAELDAGLSSIQHPASSI